MSAEDFQILHKTVFDNSMLKRDIRNKYHQQAVNLKDSGKNFDLIFGENSNYNQIGNA